MLERQEDNPLKWARLALGMSRQEFARRLDLSCERIAAAELGYLRKLPDRWLPRLESIGVEDARSLADRYEAWRRADLPPSVGDSEATRP